MAILRINCRSDSEVLLDNGLSSRTINALERIPNVKFREANEKTTALLLIGTQVEVFRAGTRAGTSQLILREGPKD